MGLIEQVGKVIHYDLAWDTGTWYSEVKTPPHINNFLLQHEATARFPHVVMLFRFSNT